MERERIKQTTNGVTFTPGTLAITNSAATMALLLPTSDSLRSRIMRHGGGWVVPELGRIMVSIVERTVEGLSGLSDEDGEGGGAEWGGMGRDGTGRDKGTE